MWWLLSLKNLEINWMSFPGFHLSLLSMWKKARFCVQMILMQSTSQNIPSTPVLSKFFFVKVAIIVILSYELSLTQTIEHWYPLSHGRAPVWSLGTQTNIWGGGRWGDQYPYYYNWSHCLLPARLSFTLTRDVPSYKPLEVDRNPFKVLSLTRLSEPWKHRWISSMVGGNRSLFHLLVLLLRRQKLAALLRGFLI